MLSRSIGSQPAGRVVLLLLLLLLCTMPATAQTGDCAGFRGDNLGSCGILDRAPNPAKLHEVHKIEYKSDGTEGHTSGPLAHTLASGNLRAKAGT